MKLMTSDSKQVRLRMTKRTSFGPVGMRIDFEDQFFKCACLEVAVYRLHVSSMLHRYTILKTSVAVCIAVS